MVEEKIILELLQGHKVYITTIKKWNIYAKENSLPSSGALIKIFGTWNNMKEKLGIVVNNQNKKNKKYTKEGLLAVAYRHSEHFTTYKTWNQYASK